MEWNSPDPGSVFSHIHRLVLTFGLKTDFAVFLTKHPMRLWNLSHIYRHTLTHIHTHTLLNMATNSRIWYCFKKHCPCSMLCTSKFCFVVVVVVCLFVCLFAFLSKNSNKEKRHKSVALSQGRKRKTIVNNVFCLFQLCQMLCGQSQWTGPHQVVFSGMK